MPRSRSRRGYVLGWAAWIVEALVVATFAPRSALPWCFGVQAFTWFLVIYFVALDARERRGKDAP